MNRNHNNYHPVDDYEMPAVTVEVDNDVDILPDDNAVHVIGVTEVTTDDGDVLTVGAMRLNGEYVMLVDVDHDGSFDVMMVDNDHDGEISDNEIFELSEPLPIDDIASLVDIDDDSLTDDKVAIDTDDDDVTYDTADAGTETDDADVAVITDEPMPDDHFTDDYFNADDMADDFNHDFDHIDHIDDNGFII